MEEGATGDRSPLVWIIAGPTASGKTHLSLQLASELNAEILSVDSRQVYRHLDIGTAKPNLAEQQGIVHHFIDEKDPTEVLSAGQYAEEAWRRIQAVHQQKKRVIAVGGSTLYLYALQFGLSNIPEVPDEIRQSLNQRLKEEGAQRLFAELERIDPQTALTMDPSKSQRIVRALEVYQGTGRPLSSYHSAVEVPFAFKTVILDWDRAALYDRINRRVDQMIDRGLVDEVRRLKSMGFSPDLPSLNTIGYKEVFAHLDGAIDRAEMIRLIKRNTRRYAKRQLTWFRRFPEFEWVRSADAYSFIMKEDISSTL